MFDCFLFNDLFFYTHIRTPPTSPAASGHAKTGGGRKSLSKKAAAAAAAALAAANKSTSTSPTVGVTGPLQIIKIDNSWTAELGSLDTSRIDGVPESVARFGVKFSRILPLSSPSSSNKSVVSTTVIWLFCRDHAEQIQWAIDLMRAIDSQSNVNPPEIIRRRKAKPPSISPTHDTQPTTSTTKSSPTNVTASSSASVVKPNNLNHEAVLAAAQSAQSTAAVFSVLSAGLHKTSSTTDPNVPTTITTATTTAAAAAAAAALSMSLPTSTSTSTTQCTHQGCAQPKLSGQLFCKSHIT
jgi:hypothetical protein